MSADEAILRAINASAASPTIAAIAIVLSSRWMIALVGLPLLFAFGRARLPAFALAWVAVGAADLTSSQLIKPVVARERPCRALEGLERPVSCGVGRSFPSSHASTSFALAAASAGMIGLRGLWVLPVALLVALSRVVLGVHYPSDVTAGAILGACVGGLFALAWRLRAPRTPPAIDPPSPSGSAPPSP